VLGFLTGLYPVGFEGRIQYRVLPLGVKGALGHQGTTIASHVTCEDIFFRECPRLDAATKALLNNAYEERMAESPQEDQRRPKQTVAAVGTSLGPPRSSSDDTPPPGVEAEELVGEDKSSSENE